MYELFEKYLLYYDLCAEGRNALKDAAKKICGDEKALSEALQIKNKLTNLSEDYDHSKELSSKSAQFAAFVYTAAIEQMEIFYQKNEISKDIFSATLNDMSVWINKHYEWTAEWGLSEGNWLQNHIRGNLFALGRLQFAKGRAFGAEIYKNSNGGFIILPVESKKDGDFIYSDVVYENGYAIEKKVKLHKDEWQTVLKKGDPYLEVHIPRGGKLTNESCLESFKMAEEFFKDYPFKAFGCFTWLFDPTFDNLLPTDSNIIKFRRMFMRFPYGGESYGGLTYVFVNINRDNIKDAPRDTYFRRTLAEYVESGGTMRAGGGYRLNQRDAGPIVEACDLMRRF